MNIQLVRDDEKLTHKHGKSKIYYRRISVPRRNLVIKKHTKKGRVDWPSVTDDLLAYAITGWSGVQDEGKDVPFSADLIGSLPDEVCGDIMEKSGGAIPDEDKEDGLGNS